MTITHFCILIGSILALGFINIIRSGIKLYDQILVLGNYLDIVNRLSNKTSSKKITDITQEALWVLSNTDVIDEIVKPSYHSSIHGLMNNIVVNNSIGINLYSTRLSREIVSWVSKLERKKKTIKGQLANPFVWFYRGIELITMIVIGYPIQKFNPSFDYDSKSWKAVNLVFSIVSGLSSIVGLYITIRK